MKKELYDIKDCQSATQTSPPIEDTEEKTCKINFLQFVMWTLTLFVGFWLFCEYIVALMQFDDDMMFVYGLTLVAYTCIIVLNIIVWIGIDNAIKRNKKDK